MRFLALLGCLLPLALAGCGDSGHKSPNAEAGDTSGGDTSSDAEMTSTEGSAENAAPENALADDVLLTLDGKHEVLGGGARLEVKELQPLVLLAVTTIFPSNHDNLLMLQLGVQGVENVVGQHTEQLTNTKDAVTYAYAYIDQVSYSSQSGTLDVTLSSDGTLEGHFDAQLVPDPAAGGDASPLGFSGYFSGKWSLLCSSPVLILPGDHSVSDSPYCKNLQF
jgi:hypothetical protein